MPAFERVLDEVHPDLIHAGPIQSCAFITALAGFRPLVAMSWGSDLLVDADVDPLSRWATRYALCRSDFLVTDSSEVSDLAARYCALAEGAIVQFPWGVDLDVFKPGGTVDATPGDWDDAFVLISIRAWEPRYGILTVLDGFRRALSDNPHLRLLLLGDGSMREQVQSYLAEHGLATFVCTPGFVPYSRLPDYFRSADAYVSCAFSDGSSVSLLEALASGLPVIVTDRPSNREWVTPDENGWLVLYADVESVRAAFLRAAALAPSQREAIRAANRAVAEARANWSRNVAKLLDAYHTLETRTLARTSS
jgi:glycosyltransferase involved in cell wall biosynthesis